MKKQRWRWTKQFKQMCNECGEKEYLSYQEKSLDLYWCTNCLLEAIEIRWSDKF